MRSVYLQKDKTIFKLAELPAERFAEALGLPGAPKIKFLSRELAKSKKNAPRAAQNQESESDGNWSGVESEGGADHNDSSSLASSENEASDTLPAKPKSPKVCSPLFADYRVSIATKPGVRTKYDRMFERRNQNILSTHYQKLVDHTANDDPTGDGDADEFITLKRANHDLPEGDGSEPPNAHKENLSKRKLKLGKAKRAIVKYSGLSRKVVFDEDGKPHDVYEMADTDEFYKDGLEAAKEAGKKFAEGERSKMKERDIVDKEEAREKKREKKRKRKEREKEARLLIPWGPMGV
jgi:ATP-dependent RNA helicase DDX10/DBP4